MQDGDVSYLAPEYRALLDEADDIKAAYREQPQHLDHITALIKDLYLDFCRWGRGGGGGKEAGRVGEEEGLQCYVYINVDLPPRNVLPVLCGQPVAPSPPSPSLPPG